MTARELPTQRRGPRDEGGPAAAESWWDEGLHRWLSSTEDVDHVEVVLEDYGGTSVLRRLATTLSGTYGTQLYRFVARPLGDPVPSSERVAVSGTFPVSPLDVAQDDVHPRHAWSQEAADRLAELDHELVAAGWHLRERGSHWWSRVYDRPRPDDEASGDAPSGPTAVG